MEREGIGRHLKEPDGIGEHDNKVNEFVPCGGVVQLVRTPACHAGGWRVRVPSLPSISPIRPALPRSPDLSCDGVSYLSIEIKIGYESPGETDTATA